MKELSLNVLDIAENSLKAGATLTEIYIDESSDALTIKIKDNGCGMSEETVKSVTNPFYTTRTTRRVGLGIPLFQLAASQTGGTLSIKSKTVSEGDDHGTEVVAVFFKSHIDFTPLGDIISTLTTLIQGHCEVDFLYKHSFYDKSSGQASQTVTLDTRELRTVLEDIPLSSPEILLWIRENLTEQYDNIKK